MRAKQIAPGPDPPNEWVGYVQGHMDDRGWTKTDLAHAGKFDRSLLSRWLNEGTEPTVDKVRAVCRALGTDIREGLVAAGLFDPEELWVSKPGAFDMRAVSDELLLTEVARRMRIGSEDHDDETLQVLAHRIYQTTPNTGEVVGIETHKVEEGGTLTTHLRTHRENSRGAEEVDADDPGPASACGD